MIGWRVAHLKRGAEPWEDGGSLDIRREWQGQGRFDIPSEALTLYVGESQAAAVGETFGRFAVWTDATFISGYTTEPIALVTFEIDTDALELADLDDAKFLASRNIRPSDVVNRNREQTQELAYSLRLDGYDGVRWWSYYRPEWRVVSIWADNESDKPWAGSVGETGTESLHRDHPAVRTAAHVLPREIRPSTPDSD